MVLATSLILLLYWTEFKKIKAEPVNSWQVDQTADCAVVLTGGVGRVPEGFDLIQRQQVKKIIIAGVYSQAHIREIMPLWVFYPNLKEEDVILERRSETTYGNAQQSLSIVEALRCRDILLITSQLHMARAYKTFREAYPEAVQIYKHTTSNGRGESGSFDQLVEATKMILYSIFAY